nr:hypothetical protein JYN38_12245 [Salmonella enterica subsp. enterica serovar Anatum]
MLQIDSLALCLCVNIKNTTAIPVWQRQQLHITWTKESTPVYMFTNGLNLAAGTLSGAWSSAIADAEKPTANNVKSEIAAISFNFFIIPPTGIRE